MIKLQENPRYSAVIIDLERDKFFFKLKGRRWFPETKDLFKILEDLDCALMSGFNFSFRLEANCESGFLCYLNGEEIRELAFVIAHFLEKGELPE